MTRAGAPVAVVTGATRGAGHGIAIALGRHGCTVYVTGRSRLDGESARGGTVDSTADAVSQAGGHGIAVQVDHSRDDQVRELFDRVRREHGRVDILVNNATALHPANNSRVPFWEKPLDVVEILGVGLRSAYVASYYAAPLLLAADHGMIVFTSGSGAAHYVFNPAYGAQKAGVDKFAADMAVDFAGTEVTTVSIWMGGLLTDRLKMLAETEPERYGAVAATAETTEFTGHIVWALFNDPGLPEFRGHTLIGAEVAARYGLTDAGGRTPPSYRDTHGVAPLAQYPAIIR